MHYSPQAAQFPASLKSVAAPLEQQQYAAAIAAAKALEPKLNRSFEDQLWMLRGMAHQGLGEEKEALASFERAIKVRPNNLIALFQHALLLKKTKRCDKAMVEFKEIAWQVKDLAYEMKFLTGECLASLNRNEEALKQFEAAYKQNPKFLPVIREMVRARKQVLASTANPQQRAAIEAQLAADLNSLNSAEPNDRESALELAKMLLTVKDPLIEAGKLSRGESLAKKMAEESGWKDDEFVRLLAQAQIKRGALEEAEETIERGLKESPDSKLLTEEKQQLTIERTVKSDEPATQPKK